MCLHIKDTNSKCPRGRVSGLDAATYFAKQIHINSNRFSQIFHANPHWSASKRFDALLLLQRGPRPSGFCIKFDHIKGNYANICWALPVSATIKGHLSLRQACEHLTADH